MTLNGYKIDQKIFSTFGGRFKTKKVNQKSRPKPTGHVDYSKIRLNPINTNQTEIHSEIAIADTNPQYPLNIEEDYQSFNVENYDSTMNFPIPSEPMSPSTTTTPQSTNISSFKYNYNDEDLNIFGTIYSPQRTDAIHSSQRTEESVSISCSDIECDITPPPNTEFNIDNIGPMGAITTPNYNIKVGEEIKFEQNRQRQISEDLNDLLITDSDDDDDEFESIEYLLKFCGIHSCSDKIIYDYFNQILCVYNSFQLANIDPYLIIRPYAFYNFSVKQLIKLNRFVQYISHKISENSNNWKYNIKWMTLNENQFHTTYQTKSKYLVNYQEHEVKKMLTDCEIIQLNANAHYTEVFYCGQKEQTFKLKVIQLPEFSRFKPELFSVGIQIGDNKICITDRLSIFMNDSFISNIGHGTFIENNDEIIIKINMNDNIANVKLMYSVYQDNIPIEMKQTFNFGDMFVEQNKGTGLYTVNIDKIN